MGREEPLIQPLGKMHLTAPHSLACHHLHCPCYNHHGLRKRQSKLWKRAHSERESEGREPVPIRINENEMPYLRCKFVCFLLFFFFFVISSSTSVSYLETTKEEQRKHQRTKQIYVFSAPQERMLLLLFYYRNKSS